MKKFLIERYIISSIIPYIALALIITSTLLGAQQLAGFADVLGGVRAPLELLPAVLGVVIPGVLIFTIPFAVLSGVLIGYGRLHGNREAVILQAIGAGKLRRWLPVVLLGVAAAGGSLYIGFVITPHAARALRGRVIELARNRFQTPIPPGTFETSMPGIVVYARGGNHRTGEWQDLFIREAAAASAVRLITARTGRLDYTGTGEVVELVLSNARATTLQTDASGEVVTSVVTEQLAQTRVRLKTGIGNLLAQVETQSPQLEELGGAALLQQARGAATPETRVAAETVLWRRLWLCVAPFSLALVAGGLGLKMRRDGRLTPYLWATGTLFLYYALTLYGEQLARHAILPAGLALGMANGAMLVIGITLIITSDNVIGINILRLWRYVRDPLRTERTVAFPVRETPTATDAFNKQAAGHTTPANAPVTRISTHAAAYAASPHEADGSASRANSLDGADQLTNGNAFGSNPDGSINQQGFFVRVRRFLEHRKTGGGRGGINPAALLDRSIGREIVVTLAATLALLSGLFVTFTIFDLWKFVARHNIENAIIGQYIFYLQPYLLLALAPAAFFIALLTAYSQMVFRYEVTAWLAAGQSLYRLSVIGVVSSLVLGSALWQVQEKLAPTANRRQDELREYIKRGAAFGQTATEQWYAGRAVPRIYAYRQALTERELLNPVFYDFSVTDGHLTAVTFADGARIGDVRDGTTVELELVRGRQLRFEQGGKQLSLKTLSDSGEVTELFKKTLNKPFYLSTAEMRRELADLSAASAVAPQTELWRVALARRPVKPVEPLVLSLLALPMAFACGRFGKLAALAVAVLAAAGYWLAAEGAFILGVYGWLPPALAAWSPVLIFAALGLYLLARLRT